MSEQVPFGNCAAAINPNLHAVYASLPAYVVTPNFRENAARILMKLTGRVSPANAGAAL